MRTDIYARMMEVAAKQFEGVVYEMITRKFEDYIDSVTQDYENFQRIVELRSPFAKVRIGTRSLSRRLFSAHIFSSVMVPDTRMLYSYITNPDMFWSILYSKLLYVMVNIFMVLIGAKCDLAKSQCNKEDCYEL